MISRPVPFTWNQQLAVSKVSDFILSDQRASFIRRSYFFWEKDEVSL